MKKDKLLRQKPPLVGVIFVRGKHNHHLDCASVSNYLRPSDELRQTFEGYFVNGMTPAKALLYHETMLLMKDDGPKLVANGHYMPLMQTVYYWHQQWTLLNYGPLDQPLDTLIAKIDMYAEKGRNLKSVFYCDLLTLGCCKKDLLHFQV